MKKSDLIWAMTDIQEDLLCRAKEVPAEKKHSPAIRIVLIAAIIVVLLTGTVFAFWHWDDLLTARFQIGEAEQEMMESAVADVYATAEQDGCVFTVKQIMGDEHCMVVSLDIQLPESLVLPEFDVAELKTLAEENGHDWEDVEYRLHNESEYQEGDPVVTGVVDVAGSLLVPVHMDKETLIQESDAYYSDFFAPEEQSLPFAKHSAIAYILFQKAVEKFGGNKLTGEHTNFGNGGLYRSYDEETHTLSSLVFMYTDNSIPGSECTLALTDLSAEDLIATYSQPYNRGEFQYITENLLTEPVVINFNAAYEPLGRSYTITKDGLEIGTLELSPFSAYASFPQPPDDPDRLSPNRIDYIDDQDIMITLKDGSTVTLKCRGSGFTANQRAFFFAEQVFDLEAIESISLQDYTFVPTE